MQGEILFSAARMSAREIMHEKGIREVMMITIKNGYWSKAGKLKKLEKIIEWYLRKKIKEDYYAFRFLIISSASNASLLTVTFSSLRSIVRWSTAFWSPISPSRSAARFRTSL